VFLHSSGNPKIPTIAEAMDKALTPEERERFASHLRVMVEEGQGVWRMPISELSNPCEALRNEGSVPTADL
jgi:hypothetical protein